MLVVLKVISVWTTDIYFMPQTRKDMAVNSDVKVQGMDDGPDPVRNRTFLGGQKAAAELEIHFAKRSEEI